MQVMRALLGYAEEYAVYDARGSDAPPEIRKRVLFVAARASRELN